MRQFIFLLFLFLMILSFSCKSKTDNEGPKQTSVSNNVCDSLADQVKLYYRIKDSIIKSRYGAQQLRIDTAFGNAYIEAYIREGGKDKTEGVILDLPTIALFYDYLLKNPGLKIGVSLGRYNKKYWNVGRNIVDPEFDGRVAQHQYNRLAFIFGGYDSRKGFLPFLDSRGGAFYDDWNQEWP